MPCAGGIMLCGRCRAHIGPRVDALPSMRDGSSVGARVCRQAEDGLRGAHRHPPWFVIRRTLSRIVVEVVDLLTRPWKDFQKSQLSHRKAL